MDGQQDISLCGSACAGGGNVKHSLPSALQTFFLQPTQAEATLLQLSCKLCECLADSKIYLCVGLHD